MCILIFTPNFFGVQILVSFFMSESVILSLRFNSYWCKLYIPILLILFFEQYNTSNPFQFLSMFFPSSFIILRTKTTLLCNYAIHSMSKIDLDIHLPHFMARTCRFALVFFFHTVSSFAATCFLGCCLHVHCQNVRPNACGQTR